MKTLSSELSLNSSGIDKRHGELMGERHRVFGPALVLRCLLGDYRLQPLPIFSLAREMHNPAVAIAMLIRFVPEVHSAALIPSGGCVHDRLREKWAAYQSWRLVGILADGNRNLWEVRTA